MSRLLQALRNDRVLLMDGGMGTQLQQFEANPVGGFETWNLTHPERVRAVHRAYAAAGADVLLANTFQANPAVLKEKGHEPQHLIAEGVALARAEAAAGLLVLASVGPFPDPTPDSLARLFTGAIQADGLLLETWSRLPTLSTSTDYPPVMLSFTFWRRPDGRILTIHEETPEALATQANRLPIAALGVNCGRDMDLDASLEVLRRYREETDLPLFARPNAGTPRKTSSGGEYPLSPENLAERLPEFLELGVRMMGGCCGTTPAHIAALRPAIDAWNSERTSPKR